MKRLALLTVLLAACGQEQEDKISENEARAKAESAAAELMAVLGQKLTSTLHTEPPEKALHICGDVAQDITKEICEKHGVSMRRTALRVRNPKNAPDEYEVAWMKAAQDRDDMPYGGEGEVVGDELRFVRPLFLAELCQKCHGESLSAEVQAAVKERYPEDKATGFKPGELRGIISVRVALR